MKTAFGGVLIGVLAWMAGILIGAAAVLGMRHGGLDLYGRMGLVQEQPQDLASSPEESARPKNAELMQMLAEAGRVRQRLENEQREVSLSTVQLQQEREALSTLKKQIEDAEQRVTAHVLTQDEAEKKNIKRLAKMWSQLEPKEVMEIARGLDDLLVAHILRAMNDRQAAPILAALGTFGTEGTKRVATVVKELQILREAPVPQAQPPAGVAQ